jgi:hypothetical protein
MSQYFGEAEVDCSTSRAYKSFAQDLIVKGVVFLSVGVAVYLIADWLCQR